MQYNITVNVLDSLTRVGATLDYRSNHASDVVETAEIYTVNSQPRFRHESTYIGDMSLKEATEHLNELLYCNQSRTFLVDL